MPIVAIIVADDHSSNYEHTIWNIKMHNDMIIKCFDNKNLLLWEQDAKRDENVFN